jgi:hypothetical protein
LKMGVGRHRQKLASLLGCDLSGCSRPQQGALTDQGTLSPIFSPPVGHPPRRGRPSTRSRPLHSIPGPLHPHPTPGTTPRIAATNCHAAALLIPRHLSQQTTRAQTEHRVKMGLGVLEDRVMAHVPGTPTTYTATAKLTALTARIQGPPDTLTTQTGHSMPPTASKASSATPADPCPSSSSRSRPTTPTTR